MNKNEGLLRLAKFVNYLGIAIATSIALFAFVSILDNATGYDFVVIALIVATAIYFLFKGIAWIIDGFASD